VLELSILSAMRGRLLYGYDIVKRLRDIDGLVISEGTIYPILSRFKPACCSSRGSSSRRASLHRDATLHHEVLTPRGAVWRAADDVFSRSERMRCRRWQVVPATALLALRARGEEEVNPGTGVPGLAATTMSRAARYSSAPLASTQSI
jgi:hypothetical protein